MIFLVIEDSKKFAVERNHKVSSPQGRHSSRIVEHYEAPPTLRTDKCVNLKSLRKMLPRGVQPTQTIASGVYWEVRRGKSEHEGRRAVFPVPF